MNPTVTWIQSHSVLAGAAVAAGLVVVLGLRGVARRLRGVDPADAITVVIALAATGYAGTGTWKYLTDAMNYGVDLKVFLVAVLEGAQVAEALRARKNIRDLGSAGVDGIGLWVLTGISAVLSTSVAGNVREALGRAVIPLVGAWLWERALAPQRRAHRAKVGGPVRWRITPERIAVWLRLADAVDTDVSAVDAGRKVVKFLRVTDRERDGWRWPFTKKSLAYRGRMRLVAGAMPHGDPVRLLRELSNDAFNEALARAKPTRTGPDQQTGPDQTDPPTGPDRTASVDRTGPDRPDQTTGPDRTTPEAPSGPDQTGPADQTGPDPTGKADRTGPDQTKVPDQTGPDHGPDRTTDRPSPDRTTRRPAGGKRAASLEDLEAISRSWAKAHDMQPSEMRRRHVLEAVRAEGLSCSNERAGEVLALLDPNGAGGTWMAEKLALPAGPALPR